MQRASPRHEAPLAEAPGADERPGGLLTAAALHRSGQEDPMAPGAPATPRRAVCVPGPPGLRGMPARRAVLTERQWVVVHSVITGQAVPQPGEQIPDHPPFASGLALASVLAACVPGLVAVAAASNARMPRSWVKALLTRTIPENGVPPHAPVEAQASALLPHLRTLGRRLWANFTLLLLSETSVEIRRADSHPLFRRATLVLLRDGAHHVRLMWPRSAPGRGHAFYLPFLDSSEWYSLCKSAVVQRKFELSRLDADGGDPLPKSVWFRGFGRPEQEALQESKDPRPLLRMTPVRAVGVADDEAEGKLEADGDRLPVPLSSDAPAATLRDRFRDATPVELVQRVCKDEVPATDGAAARDALVESAPRTDDSKAVVAAMRTSKLPKSQVIAILEALAEGHDVPRAREELHGDYVPSDTMQLYPESMSAGTLRAAPEVLADPAEYKRLQPLAAAIWGTSRGLMVYVTARFDKEGTVALDLRNPSPLRPDLQARWSEFDSSGALESVEWEAAMEAVKGVWWDRDNEKSLLDDLQEAETFDSAVASFDSERLKATDASRFEAAWAKDDPDRLGRLLRTHDGLPDETSAATASRLLGLPVVLIRAYSDATNSTGANVIRIDACAAMPDGTEGPLRVHRAAPQLAVIVIARDHRGAEKVLAGTVDATV